MGFAVVLDHTLQHWYHYSTVTALEIIHKSVSKELVEESSTFFQLFWANAERFKKWLFLSSRWSHTLHLLHLTHLGELSSFCVRAHLANSDTYQSSSWHQAFRAEDFLVYV